MGRCVEWVLRYRGSHLLHHYSLNPTPNGYTIANMTNPIKDFLDVIKSRRSIRRFSQREISPAILVELVEAARSAPSAANKQPLEYVVVSDPAVRAQVFANVAWAGYIRPKRNPGPGQEPKAYIILLVNKSIAGEHGAAADVGAAAENIMLAAWSMGIGSCWMGAIQRAEIAKILQIPENMSIDTLVALGYPAEEPLMEDVKDASAPDAVRYYLDENDRLHVPKRKLDSIGHLNEYGKALK
jgi:nitroreductase